MSLSRMAWRRARLVIEPPGKQKQPSWIDRIQRGPKTQKRPKRKREEKPVPAGHAGDGQNLQPVVHDVLPALGGIQPAYRHRGGAAGLMAAHVGLQRKRQVRPIRRVGQAVANDLMPRSDRDESEETPRGRRRADRRRKAQACEHRKGSRPRSPRADDGPWRAAGARSRPVKGTCSAPPGRRPPERETVRSERSSGSWRLKTWARDDPPPHNS